MTGESCASWWKSGAQDTLDFEYKIIQDPFKSRGQRNLQTPFSLSRELQVLLWDMKTLPVPGERLWLGFAERSVAGVAVWAWEATILLLSSCAGRVWSLNRGAQAGKCRRNITQPAVETAVPTWRKIQIRDDKRARAQQKQNGPFNCCIPNIFSLVLYRDWRDRSPLGRLRASMYSDSTGGLKGSCQWKMCQLPVGWGKTQWHSTPSSLSLYKRICMINR